jgi:hypothetical protein
MIVVRVVWRVPLFLYSPAAEKSNSRKPECHEDKKSRGASYATTRLSCVENLTLCWDHNWSECSLEVLELGSVIDTLGG